MTIVFKCLLLVTLGVISFSGHAQSNTSGESREVKTGRFLGAKETVMPEWFKESFLDFEEDIAEAAEHGKRLILYFHQAGCPYCNKLIEENFTDPVIGKKVREDFDLVAINMWGDREVVQVGGREFTEKTLAAAMNVNFTPTLLFFNENKQVALRLDGYYPGAEFLQALQYVSGKHEKTATYPEWLASKNTHKKDGALTASSIELVETEDLSVLGKGKPFAVLFEEPECDACNVLHDKVFQNESAGELLGSFDLVRLNRWSDSSITTPGGQRQTVSDWANELELGYSPALVFYSQDKQRVITVDAMFKTFHVLGAFDYVASGAYQTESSFQRFLSERAEKIRHTGKDVDIWRY